MPGLRHQGRALALQLLYQIEVAGDPGEGAVERFWADVDASKRAQAFAMVLFRTTRDNQAAIDVRLAAHLENWKLHRLSVTVRNLLRMAAAEIVHPGDDETAPAIVMNEAIELAREFVDEEAARFVNGVLDSLSRDLDVAGPARVEPPPKAG